MLNELKATGRAGGEKRSGDGTRLSAGNALRHALSVVAFGAAFSA